MTVRTLRAHTSCPSDVLLDRLANFQHKTESLSVTAADGMTKWRLPFRGSSVTWTQRAEIRADRTGLAFEQVEGDLFSLKGEWEITQGAPACEVCYTVDYRTSIAHLAGAIDPLVGRVLLQAAVTVLTATAPPVRVLDGDQWLDDLTPELRRLLPEGV